MCNCKQDKEPMDGYPFLTADDMPEPLPVPEKPPRDEIKRVEETGAMLQPVETVDPSPEQQAQLTQRDALLQRLAEEDMSINHEGNIPPSGDPA